MIAYHNPNPSVDVVALLSGYQAPSNNRKTGPMLQLDILTASVNPLDAVQSGADSKVCGSCILRGKLGKRACYVNVARAPKNKWRTWRAGRYSEWTADLAEKIRRRKRPLRFGAYGDPMFLPLAVVRKLIALVPGWTGYTHRWRDVGCQWGRVFFMASVQSEAEKARAQALGWRTFRTLASWEQPAADEILCPATKEGGARTTCARCLLCNGADGAPGEDVRKNIAAYVHGETAGVRKFERMKLPLLD